LRSSCSRWWWRWQNPPPRSEEGDQSGPKNLVFDGDNALVHEKLRAPGVRVFSRIYGGSQRTHERGHKGRMGLHHAARKWSHMVHHLWCLVGPLISFLCSESSFSMKNSIVFFPKFISEVSWMKKTERGFLIKIASVLVVFIQALVRFRIKH
jgi:hypothetical protein